MVPTPQPLEYNDGLLSGAAGPSVCGPGESPVAKAAAHRMVHTLRGNHRPLDIIAFGGSVTHGDEWQGVVDGNVFPRVLASQLVERGLARSVRVRNLAIGATHGAAPMALCCDTLIHEGSAIRTLDINQNYDRRRWPWEVNRTYRGPVPPAEMSVDAPPPIILLEFGINGISWVDVLLKRLRQRYPRAILVYVDLTGLHAWRTATPTAGRPNQLGWSPMWEAAPACTAQLQAWLQQAGCEFWAMRAALRRLRVSYGRASTVYYHGDKKHLKQAGHTLVGRGVALTLTLTQPYP